MPDVNKQIPVYAVGACSYFRIIINEASTYGNAMLNNVKFFVENTTLAVNADFAATSGLAQILNKPPVPVNADFSATTGLAQKWNKPPVPVNADWNATTGLALF